MARYSCSFTTTGNSKALRLDSALIAAHPEFGVKGAATATVIAPGQMLVSVPAKPAADDDDDPIFEAFLHLLAEDIANHPERLHRVDDELIARAAAITTGVRVDDYEVMPDDVSL
jgi:prlF antitoxin for toxin YhaV_toxin